MMRNTLAIVLMAVLMGPAAAQSAGEAALTPAQQRAAAEATRIATLRAEIESLLGDALAEGDTGRANAIISGGQAKGLPLDIVALLRASVCNLMQDLAGEEKELRGAIYRNPKLAEAHERLAVLLDRRGLWTEAVASYQRAITCDPGRPGPYLELSAVLMDHERYASALAALEAGRTAVPDDPAVAVTLAQAYEAMGDAEAALSEYRRATGLDQGALRRRALVKAADLGASLGQVGQAVDDYRQAVREGVLVGLAMYRRLGSAADRAAAAVLDDCLARAVAPEASPDPAADAAARSAAVAQGLARAQEILDFLDRLDPPAECRGEHARRRYGHSLVVEALTNLTAAVTEGDSGAEETARLRAQEAAEVFAALEATAAAASAKP